MRGPNVFAGYWRQPERTAAECTADGFFRTGDVGLFDADGYLSIVGRSKDLIISGGLNVYPKEVEAVLDELDGVVESAVIGVPDPDFGEAVVAVVVAERRARRVDPRRVRAAARARLAGVQGAQAGRGGGRPAPQRHGQGGEGEAPRRVRAAIGGRRSVGATPGQLAGRRPRAWSSESVKATPCQAMSKAVPWSTEVRMMGSPRVTFTPVSKASSFIGPWPWSWYMHTMAS